MALTLIASTDRARRRRIGREIRRFGHEVLWAAGTGQTREALQDGPVDVLVVDSSLPGPGGVLPLLRWTHRHRPRTGILVIENSRGSRLEAACEKLRVPCIVEPVATPILRYCLQLLLESRSASTRAARGLASARRKPSGPAEEGSGAHEIDDLWFAVFQRMLKRPPGRRPRRATSSVTRKGS